MANFPAAGRISGYWIQGMYSLFSPSVILRGYPPPARTHGGWVAPFERKVGEGGDPHPPTTTNGMRAVVAREPGVCSRGTSGEKIRLCRFFGQEKQKPVRTRGGRGTPLAARHMGGGVPPTPPYLFLSRAARFTKYHRVSTTPRPSFPMSARFSENSFRGTRNGGSE